jgi:peptidylprolyl isomerase
MTRWIGLAALALAAPSLAQEAEPPTPASVVAAAKPEEWAAIDPTDLLVMELVPDAAGARRTVVIQLMPAPFSQGWVGNIRTLAKRHWWDGTTVYRVVDNWVAQWGDGEDDEAKAKPLPEGLRVVRESEYVVASRVKLRARSKDTYSANTGFREGWPVASNCYASVGVARNLSPDTGTGAELYAVIGHAPRQLDRNIAVVGRVIEGIEHLSVLPRGKGEAGVYDDPKLRVPIVSVRLGNELPEPPKFQYLSTESESFAEYVRVRANRSDSFYKVPAGGIDVCNVQVPIRRVPSE